LKFFQFTKKQIRIIAIIIAAVMILGTVGLFIGVNVTAKEQSAPASEQDKDAKAEAKAESIGEGEKLAEASEADAEGAGGGANSEGGSAPAPASGSPVTAQAEPGVISCTVLVNCANIAKNLDKLDPSKRSLIPEGGNILSKTTVQLPAGATAFDALLAATGQKGIHMEYSGSPLAKTAYIEGIGNIYQFDCGPLSGWLYAVNGSYVGVGMSSYSLNNGDAVELRYTLDLGADLGASGVRQ
jgi:hypothetical protein